MPSSPDIGEIPFLADALGRAFRGSESDNWSRFRKSLYAVPCEGYLLYAPLQGLVLPVSGGEIARLLLELKRPIPLPHPGRQPGNRFTPGPKRCDRANVCKAVRKI